MPIHLVCGKPGGGKGLHYARKFEEVLTRTESPIVTNFAIELLPWVNGKGKPQLGLLAYLRYKYHGNTFFSDTRIFRITDEQASKFYLYRPVRDFDKKGVVYHLEEAEAYYKETRDGDRVVSSFDLSIFGRSSPCVYFIDEAWAFWASRHWQKTGDGVQAYNSQHRKAGDEVYIATQHTKQIDPAIPRLCQDFQVCRNGSLLRMGIFRQPSTFKVSIFEDAPTGSIMQKPMATEKFKADFKGLAQTYDTTGGVGLAGRLSGDSPKAKGLPFWVLPILGCLVPVIAYFVLAHGFKWGVKQVTSVVLPGGSSTNSARGTNRVSGVASYFLPSGFNPGAGTNTGSASAAATNEPVRMVGYGGFDDHVFAMLSDGRIFRSGDNHLQLLTRDFCVVDGVRFSMDRRVPVRSSGYIPAEVPPVSGDIGPPISRGPSVLSVIGGASLGARYYGDTTFRSQASSVSRPNGGF